MVILTSTRVKNVTVTPWRENRTEKRQENNVRTIAWNSLLFNPPTQIIFFSIATKIFLSRGLQYLLKNILTQVSVQAWWIDDKACSLRLVSMHTDRISWLHFIDKWFVHMYMWKKWSHSSWTVDFKHLNSETLKLWNSDGLVHCWV